MMVVPQRLHRMCLVRLLEQVVLACHPNVGVWWRGCWWGADGGKPLSHEDLRALLSVSMAKFEALASATGGDVTPGGAMVSRPEGERIVAFPLSPPCVSGEGACS